MTKQTFHRGADLERQAFKRKLKRFRKIYREETVCEHIVRKVIDELLWWVETRTARYKKKKGGL